MGEDLYQFLVVVLGQIAVPAFYLSLPIAFYLSVPIVDRLIEHDQRPAPELPLYIYRNSIFPVPIAMTMMCLMNLFVFFLSPFEYFVVLLLAELLIVLALIREGKKVSLYPLEHEGRSEEMPLIKITEQGISLRLVGGWIGLPGPQELFEWSRISGFKLVILPREHSARYLPLMIQITLVDGSKMGMSAVGLRRRELLYWLNTYLDRFGNDSMVRSTHR